MTTPRYDRPVPAVMLVSLENGETFEPTAEDFAKFGYVDRNTVLADWRAFVEDATGTDLLSADSVLNPLWLALHQALNNPGSLSDGSMGNTKADIQELDRSLREYRNQERPF
ncbi:MAG TPA: hypothetical protein VF867_00025 [Arthrobacter sp.]